MRNDLGGIGLALLLCGCSTDTFGGADASPEASPDGNGLDGGNPNDASPADAVAEAPGCSVQTFTATPTVADGMIALGQPGILGWDVLGSMAARNDVGGPMEAIMRFDVTNLPSIAKVQTVTLDLAWASTSKECGGGTCSTCASFDKAGNLDVYYMRNDWNESANWSTRDGSNGWGTDGASLTGTDRSNVAATFNHTLGASASVVVSTPMFAQWRPANEVSFLVQSETTGNTASDARFFIATREGKSICSATGNAPKLTVTYCP